MMSTFIIICSSRKTKQGGLGSSSSSCKIKVSFRLYFGGFHQSIEVQLLGNQFLDIWSLSSACTKFLAPFCDFVCAQLVMYVYVWGWFWHQILLIFIFIVHGYMRGFGLIFAGKHSHFWVALVCYMACVGCIWAGSLESRFGCCWCWSSFRPTNWQFVQLNCSIPEAMASGHVQTQHAAHLNSISSKPSASCFFFNCFLMFRTSLKFICMFFWGCYVSVF